MNFLNKGTNCRGESWAGEQHPWRGPETWQETQLCPEPSLGKEETVSSDGAEETETGMEWTVAGPGSRTSLPTKPWQLCLEACCSGAWAEQQM